MGQGQSWNKIYFALVLNHNDIWITRMAAFFIKLVILIPDADVFNPSIVNTSQVVT